MKILHRYLISEIISPFLLAIAGFVIIGITDILFVLADQLINKHAPLLAILQLLIYKIPTILVIFAPMALLFAIMIVLIRMAKDNEITIIRVNGINMYRLLVPISLIALVISLLSFINNEQFVPWANHRSNTIIRQTILKKLQPEMESNLFFKDEENRIFYVKQVDATGKLLQNIVIFEDRLQYPRVLLAKQALIDNRSWVLKNGVINDYDQDGHLAQEAVFEEMIIKMDNDISYYLSNQKGPAELSSKEIKNKILLLQKSGISVRDLQIEYQLKFALPLSCFIFALIAMAYCVTLVKTAKNWWSIIVASILAALSAGFFITLTAIFRALGQGGYVSPIMAAWGANLFFAIVALGLISQRANK